MAIWSHSFTSHLCSTTLRNSRHVPWGQFERWSSRRRYPRWFRRGLWSLSISLVWAFTAIFFLVEKATGGWKSVINLSTLNGFVTLTVPDGDSCVGFGVDPKGRLDVLNQPQRPLIPDPHPSGLSPVSPVCSRRSGVPVSSLVLQPVYGSTSLHQGLLPDIRIGASVSCPSPLVSRRLADCCRVYCLFSFAITIFCSSYART